MKRALVLAVVETDATFERVEVDGRPAFRGKCLHCNAPLVVLSDGTPVSAVTIEHIVPQTAGGADDAGNLGLACPRCNHGKGVRHDRRALAGGRSSEVIDRLLEKRRRRWRAP